MPVSDHLKLAKRHDPNRQGASTSAVSASSKSWESLPPALRGAAMRKEAQRLQHAKQNAREEAAVVNSAIQQHRKKVIVKKKRISKSSSNDDKQHQNDPPPKSPKNLAWARKRHSLMKDEQQAVKDATPRIIRDDASSSDDDDDDDDDDNNAEEETENQRYARLQRKREDARKEEEAIYKKQEEAKKRASAASMQLEADAMRRRLAAMGLDIKSPKTPKQNIAKSTAAPTTAIPSTPFTTSSSSPKSKFPKSSTAAVNTITPSVERPVASSSANDKKKQIKKSAKDKSSADQPSLKLLNKKLDKVDQLLSQEEYGSKQYNKYHTKKMEYVAAIKELTELPKQKVPKIDDSKDWIAQARADAVRKEKERQAKSLEQQSNKAEVAAVEQRRQAKEKEEAQHQQNAQKEEADRRRKEEQAELDRQETLQARAQQARKEMEELQIKLERAKELEEQKPKQALTEELQKQEKERAAESDDDEEEEEIPSRPPPMGGIMGGMQAELQRKASEKQQKALERQQQEQQELQRKQEAAEQKRQEQLRQKESQQQEEETTTKTPEKSVRETLTAEDMAMDSTQRLLKTIAKSEKTQKKLEKQLAQNGIAVSEDIPYDVAKAKLEEIQNELRALMADNDGSYTFQNKYYKMEEELSKYSTALMLTDEYQAEQKQLEQDWEDKHLAQNLVALQKVRRHMPVSIRNQSEEELTTTPTPNGKMLPKPIVRKFKRTNALQLLRLDPLAIEKMHPSLLEGMRTTGLTLTERRALHEHMKEIGTTWQAMATDPSMEKKWVWFASLKAKLKEDLAKYEKHVQEYGPPGNHPYASRKDPAAGGCPMLGNQCPVKADSVISYEDDYGFTAEAIYETTEAAKTSQSGDDSAGKAALQRQNSLGTLKKNVARRGGTGNSNQGTSIDAISQSIRKKLQLPETLCATEEKLLRESAEAERRAKMLEKQLIQAGFKVADDDISFHEAKDKIATLTEDIKKVAANMGTAADPKEQSQLEVEYVKLAEELEKYNSAIMLTKEWEQEQIEKLRQWEASIEPANKEALRKIRRHMPVNIRDLSEDDMTNLPTPNGKKLPPAMVKKFKRTNVLMLLRLDPKDIEPMHPSSLEGMRTSGLTLAERQALYEHLKYLGNKWRQQANDKMIERKWMWYESLKGKYKEVLEKYEKHVSEFGAPGNHPYAKKRGDPGCPLLGNQCPLKANAVMDYSGDYGYPDENEYGKSEVKKSTLLTVEEFQARQREEQGDEGSSDGPAQKNPLGGMLKQIFSGGP